MKNLKQTSIARLPKSVLVPELFFKYVYEPHRPVIIENYLEPDVLHHRWSPTHLVKRFGDRRVEVKIFEGIQGTHGLRFQSLCLGSTTMLFRDFVEQSLQSFQGGLTYYLRLAESSRDIPEIFEEIHFPQCFNQQGTGISDWSTVDHFIRIGATSYEYPIHCDGYENFLVQLSGHKHIVFFEPSELDRLYLDGEDLHRSTVNDIDHPDLDRFPKFADTTPIYCDLKPGDLLYIPVLWFHNVRSRGWSVSSNSYQTQPNKLAYIEQHKTNVWRQYEKENGVRVY